MNPLADPVAGRVLRAATTVRFREIRGLTERLAQPLSAEDCALQSAPFASPVKWHLAHTSWFFETFVLGELVPGYRPQRPEYRVLFNSYYHAVGERHPRPERGLLSRPSLDEVREYRRRVDHAMVELLESPRGRDAKVFARTELGLQHEQQHQELLLMDVKHLFWRSPLKPAYETAARRPAQPVAADVVHGAHGAHGGNGEARAARSPRARRWRRFERGEQEIGADGGSAEGSPGGSRGFAFDNEGPRHRVLVPAFELDEALVTNGDFVQFIEDGGYRRSELWLSEGLDFVEDEQIGAPLYWSRGARTDEWSIFTLHGERPLDPDEPVCHVSCFEADAFARWAGARLPTEFEWETAARDLPIDGTFLESHALHPRGHGTVDSLRGMFGEVWQWTQSAYAAYPGYRPPEGALGEYNGKFMVNQLVLRGGSFASPRSHLRASYRNFFHANDRWQFAGLRLARDAS